MRTAVRVLAGLVDIFADKLAGDVVSRRYGDGMQMVVVMAGGLGLGVALSVRVRAVL